RQATFLFGRYGSRALGSGARRLNLLLARVQVHLLLARVQVQRADRPGLASVALSRPVAPRPCLHGTVGRAKHLHRQIFLPAARGGSLGRGYPGNALLDFPDCQFHLGLCLGLVVIGHWRPWGRPSAMVSLISTEPAASSRAVKHRAKPIEVIAYRPQRSLPSERAYRTWQAPAHRDWIYCRRERERWRCQVRREKDAQNSRT